MRTLTTADADTRQEGTVNGARYALGRGDGPDIGERTDTLRRTVNYEALTSHIARIERGRQVRVMVSF